MGTKQQCQLSAGVLGLLLAILPAASPSALPRKKDIQAASAVQQPMWLPLRLYRGYLVVVEGTVGGLPHQNVLIDTGTAPSIINARVGQELRLKVVPARLAVLNDLRVPAGKTVLPRIEVGPILVRNLPVMVRDLSAEERGLDLPIAAVIGLDALGTSSFRIDYAAKRVVFGPVPRDGTAVMLKAEAPLATVDVAVNGQTVRMLVDTGAAGLVLFQTRVADRMPLRPLPASRGTSNLSGDFSVKEFNPDDIVIGGKRFALKKAFLAPDQPDAGRTFDGLMGVGALGFKSITFDFDAHLIYLQL
jgi:predicted aspartyl protease